MQKQTQGKSRLFNRRWLFIGAALAVIAIAIIAVLITQLTQPQPSVAAYCKTYKEQRAKLANATGDTYSVAVFPHRFSSDPGDFAAAFSNLERVAPDEIRPDVETLRQIFQKIDNDPSQAFTASLSGLGTESNVKNWTNQHCDQNS
jgi:hypothetical protein